MAALLFGVHPIHTEVVNSVFNGSEILVTIGVIGGLQWFLDCQDKQPAKAWLGLNLVYLLVLFCRESGAAAACAGCPMADPLRFLEASRAGLRSVVSLPLPLGSTWLSVRMPWVQTQCYQNRCACRKADQLVPQARYAWISGWQIAPGGWLGLKPATQLWLNPLQVYYDWPE
jgi:hypothetical protein